MGPTNVDDDGTTGLPSKPRFQKAPTYAMQVCVCVHVCVFALCMWQDSHCDTLSCT